MIDPISPQMSDIIRRAGLQEYEYRYFPPSVSERPHRVYPYMRTREINVYTIQMTRTVGACQIKVYENLVGGRRKLRATWSGMEKAECEMKFEAISETVRQVVFEYKIDMVRRLRE